MSPVRMHFWQVVARVKLGSPRPMNSRLNWFIPAGVNSTVGSFGTSTSLGLRTHPLDTKKSRKASRSSSVVMGGGGSLGSGQGAAGAGMKGYPQATRMEGVKGGNVCPSVFPLFHPVIYKSG